MMFDYFHIFLSHRSRSYIASYKKKKKSFRPYFISLDVQRFCAKLWTAHRYCQIVFTYKENLFLTATHTSVICTYTWHVEHRKTRCASQPVINNLSTFFYLFWIHTAIIGHRRAMTGLTINARLCTCVKNCSQIWTEGNGEKMLVCILTNNIAFLWLWQCARSRAAWKKRLLFEQ